MTAAPKVAPLGPRLLRGRGIALEPLTASDHAGLRAATDAETFQYFPTPDFETWLAKAVADTAGGTRICFVVRNLADGAILGSTSYFDAAEKDGRVEIGSTWYSARWRGSSVNPEAKLLLLRNAFDAGYHCVVLRTDAKNARSRAAILKLGAKQDGILRAAVWMPQGYFRDSVFFSILTEEWPAVRAGLEMRLELVSERGALQFAVALAGLVPVVAGAAGAFDPALLDFAAPPQTLTHAAYLSGLLLGIGLAFWSLLPSIEKQSRLFLLLTAIVALGGLARLLTALRLGIFTPTVTGPLVMELLVTPALCLWQRKIAKQAL